MPITKQYFISCYLDVREAQRKLSLTGKNVKVPGKHPVKLRVFNSIQKNRKLYSTMFKLTQKEFESSYGSLKPRGADKDLKDQLIGLEMHAQGIAESIKPFTFEAFEKKLYGGQGSGTNVFYQFETAIKTLTENGQLGTASNYRLSLKSIKDFIEHQKGKVGDKLDFATITPAWLSQYEKYMLKTKARSNTTVSMYVRALRTVFNTAIREKEISQDIYPFGKGKYEVPASRNIKKAFNNPDLKKLFEAKPLTQEQEKAKDFWFFSYSCSGINVKDIALMRWENIRDRTLEFYRAKTINTGKKNLKPISVYLNDYAIGIIEKYGGKDRQPRNLVFSILFDKMTEAEMHTGIKNFTKFINQNLKKLALANKLTGDISTYWARHSFATNAIRNGASMEYVGEALGHADMKTTMNYFKGFEDESKKDLMEKLMNFKQNAPN